MSHACTRIVGLPCLILAGLLHSASTGAAQDAGNAARLWKDASGKYQVEAQLIEQTATTARLRTTTGQEVSVPIDRLSEADQSHLRSLRAPSDNPFAAPAPPTGTPAPESPQAPTDGTLRSLKPSPSAAATLALPDTGRTIDLSGEVAAESFQPDPQGAQTSPPAGQSPITTVDPYDKVSPPVDFTADGSRFFISIGRNKSGSPQETRGHIYAVSITAVKPTQVWDQPRAVKVLDHDLATGRTLIIDDLDQFQRGGELVMLEGLATGNPKPLFRRTLPGAGKPGFAPQVQWAALLSGSHVAAILDGKFLIWDLPAAQLIYKIDDVSAAEPPVFSANQVYVAVPQGNQVVVLHTASGTVHAKVPTGTTLKPGVAFDPSGRGLAVCFSNQFLVWDLVEDTATHQATTTEHLGSHPVHWIGPKTILSATGDAVNLDLAMSVWKYALPPSTPPVVHGNRVITATTSQQCVLTSVAIPHASADAAVQQLTEAGDAAMLVRPGSAVAIQVESIAGGEQDDIKGSLAEAAAKAGWKVSAQAPITLVAKIGRRKPQELHFRGMRPPRTESTATLTPFTAELEIRRGADVLWTRSTVNRIPPMLHLEEGETVQDAVKRFEKPDAAFFARLNLPPRIPKPEVAKAVGRSTLREGQWVDLKMQPASPSPAAGIRRRGG